MQSKEASAREKDLFRSVKVTGVSTWFLFPAAVTFVQVSAGATEGGVNASKGAVGVLAVVLCFSAAGEDVLLGLEVIATNGALLVVLGLRFLYRVAP